MSTYLDESQPQIISITYDSNTGRIIGLGSNGLLYLAQPFTGVWERYYND